jgi:hypothetical protein
MEDRRILGPASPISAPPALTVTQAWLPRLALAENLDRNMCPTRIATRGGET